MKAARRAGQGDNMRHAWAESWVFSGAVCQFGGVAVAHASRLAFVVSASADLTSVESLVCACCSHIRASLTM